jgi:hypothetical protein
MSQAALSLTFHIDNFCCPAKNQNKGIASCLLPTVGRRKLEPLVAIEVRSNLPKRNKVVLKLKWYGEQYFINLSYAPSPVHELYLHVWLLFLISYKRFLLLYHCLLFCTYHLMKAGSNGSSPYQ